MRRLFLDANVLYSAAYLDTASLRRLWRLKRTQLLSSSLAIEEARRNLMEDRPDKLSDLKNLLNDVETVTEPAGLRLTEVALLPPKDRPILLAAVHARATHLLTGDRRHFGECFGKTVAGVLVLTPGEYLELRKGVRWRVSGAG